MDVRRVADGLWYWTAPHPEWEPRDWWPERVGCVYYEAPDAIVLIDPLLPRGDEDRFLRHLDADVERRGLPVHVLLTAPWHSRDAAALAVRYGAEIRPRRKPSSQVDEIAVRDDELQVAFFIQPQRTLVSGDVFLGLGDALQLGRALPEASRRRLLELPVDRVLTTHGEPVLQAAGAAIELALREYLPA